MKEAYFAGGCFWCVTPIFMEMEGVADVVSGYSGGDEVNPTYEAVKHQRTGHREAIRILYDPEKISYEMLLDTYLGSVDPFDEGGQFIDRGHSYTLAVYYTEEGEAALARAKIAAAEAQFQKTVYIAVEPFKSFYDAEEYHQKYYQKNPEAFAKELVESGRVKE